MLPFAIKTVQEPEIRLHLLQNENDTLDVEVQTELHIGNTINLQSDVSNSYIRQHTFSVLNDAKEKVYRAFNTFLQQASEQRSFLPIEILSQYQYQRYVLILSVPRLFEIHEIFQTTRYSPWRDQGNTIFEYEGYELSLSAKHFILDSTAFLVEPGKFTVFMRSINDSDTIRFYISKFIDLKGNAPPPIQLNAQEVIEAVEQDIISRETNIPIGQLLMFPPSNEPKSGDVVEIKSCPECGGDVRRISDSFFCLECDWDNLPPLKQN